MNGFKADVDLAARKWLERLNGQFTLDAVKGFSIGRADRDVLCELVEAIGWAGNATTGVGSLAQPSCRSRSRRQRPIRYGTINCWRNLRQKVAELQKEFADFGADVENLPDVLETERRAIVAARRHDDEAVGKRLQLDSVEANSLSAYLLRDEATQQLNQLVGWVRWMREMAPANAKSQHGEPREARIFCLLVADRSRGC